MVIYRTLSILIVIMGLLVISTACTAQPESTPDASDVPATGDEGLAIVLGDISDDPGEVIEGTQPLADYLAARLGDYGITRGDVRVAASMDEMIDLLRDGEVDLYFDSVYPAALIGDASGAQPILRRWRFGVEEYHTVIFTSEDSGVTALDELPGHMVAMDSPYSTSGYVMPAVAMIEAGLTPVGYESYDDPVGEDEVGFVFSYDDENTLQWVLDGLVAAGATDDWRFDVSFPEEVRDQLVVLARTETVPRQVVVARSGMDEEMLAAIIATLTSVHETEEGEAALESFQTTRFDEFPEGIEQALEQMREMMDTVQNIPTP